MTAAEKPKADSDIIIEDLRLGVWNLRIAKTAGHQWWREIKSARPLFFRLCSDIFTLEPLRLASRLSSVFEAKTDLSPLAIRKPRLFTIFLFCQIWQGVEDTLLMHFSSLLLRRVCHD
jgi:hypothetical protein